ncbi:MAG TPA: hypothetical protein GX400_14035 [Chloroflexi bacterium]|nr:hypothetical protein [Chloroflexota bacterium]
MGKSERYPSYATCVARALSASQQPLTIDGLLSVIGRQRPLGAGARRAVYRAVREIYQAVPVAPSRIGWLSHLLQGNTFRHPLAAEEVRRGYLLLDELEHAVFFPQFFQNHRPDLRRLTIELMGGPVINAEAAIERKMWSLRLGSVFSEWIDAQGGQSRDDIMITVRDAVAGSYLVRLQPRESRDEEAIQEQNRRLALAAEEIVASLRRADKVIPTWELAALLIGRDLYRGAVPPDDLHMVLHKFSMLRIQKDGASYAVEPPVTPTIVGRQPSTRVRSGDQNRGELRAAPQRDLSEPTAWIDDEDKPFEMESGEDTCPDYESYLEGHRMAGEPGAPLSHSDYHLLEAELETLLGLEQEFGYLLPEQSKRVDDLAERLFIDPESLRDLDDAGEDFDDDDFDDDDFDNDQSPFWKN